MSVDTTIPFGKPGVASFASETFGNKNEPRFGDAPAEVTNITFTPGTTADLALYSVLNLAGSALADWNASRDAGCANYILAAPISMVNGVAMTVPVYRSGHWDMNALVWDASYDTDAKKKAAFEGSLSPTIFIGKKEQSSDTIYP